MKSNLARLMLFICLLGVHPVYAEALNIGTGEWILLSIMGIFFLAFFGGIIFLIYFLFKRRDSKHPAPSNVAINLAIPASLPQTNAVIQNTNLVKDLSKEKIALPQQHEIRYVCVSDIIRCEADDNYTTFYLEGGENVLISKSLKEYADLLKPHGFLRSHQSHLVNPSFVKSWLKEDGGVLLLKNGDKIPVSKPNRDHIKLALGK